MLFLLTMINKIIRFTKIMYYDTDVKDNGIWRLKMANLDALPLLLAKTAR